MPKKFFYHPSISLVKQILVSLSYIFIVICWIIPFLLHGPLSIYRPQLLRFAIYMSLTILLALYFFHVVFYELKNTVFILTKDRLIRKSPIKTTIIPLSEVTAFRYIRFPFRFILIRTSPRTIRLFLIIKNLSDLVQSLQEYFERENKHSVFNDLEIAKFKHRALVADFNLNQTFHIIKPLISITLSSILFSALTACWLWRLPLLFASIWIISGMLFPLIGYLIAYFLITRRFSLQLKQNPLTLPSCDTSRIYTLTALSIATAYLICGIIYKNFWIYFWH